MVGRESVNAMMRKRDSRLKLAPFTMSHTKCEAVEALPPFPQTKICRPFWRASANAAITCDTAPMSMDATASANRFRYCSAKPEYSALISIHRHEDKHHRRESSLRVQV